SQHGATPRESAFQLIKPCKGVPFFCRAKPGKNHQYQFINPPPFLSSRPFDIRRHCCPFDIYRHCFRSPFQGLFV
ncbi:MAG: hypothetical protein ACR2P4_08930, partial [Gammaproteobacteria bacterium]